MKELRVRTPEEYAALSQVNSTGQGLPQYHLPELRGPDSGIYATLRQAQIIKKTVLGNTKNLCHFDHKMIIIMVIREKIGGNG